MNFLFNKNTLLGLAFILMTCHSGIAYATGAQLKIGSLVPKNSLYHRQLMEVGEAWKKSQTGTPRFNVFTDGSQGGEAEMVRRMRIGQLQASLLSSEAQSMARNTTLHP